MVTERDLAVLVALHRYFVMSRSQIQRLCYQTDVTGRVTRRRLQALYDEKLLQRIDLEIVPPGGPSPGPAYFPSPRALQLLADYYGDERYLAGTTRVPQKHCLLHWLAVTETHLLLDAATSQSERVKCHQFYNEWDVLNPYSDTPQERFRLYLLIQETPRLVCAPDAAFLLEVDGFRKVFYLEQDRNTSGTRQIAASKTKGYEAMATGNLHRRHFPDENVGEFSVLLLAPNARRRDALRKAISERPGARLWKFAAIDELTPDGLFHDPLFYSCEGDAYPLVERLPAPEILTNP